MSYSSKIKFLFKIGWFNTLLFNFKYLPFKQAIRLPIFIGNNSRIFGLGGVYLSSDNVNTGMIKLGFKHEDCCLSPVGIHIHNDGSLIFHGSGVIGNCSSISIKKNAELSFGKNFGITGELHIHCHESITVGDNFSCAWGVRIFDTDFHEHCIPTTQTCRPMTKPISIGNQVWLCQDVKIMKGSSIPDWCTLSTGSIANKAYEVGNYTVLAGIPAHPVGVLMRKDHMYITRLHNWQITNGLHMFNKFL